MSKAILKVINGSNKQPDRPEICPVWLAAHPDMVVTGDSDTADYSNRVLQLVPTHTPER